MNELNMIDPAISINALRNSNVVNVVYFENVPTNKMRRKYIAILNNDVISQSRTHSLWSFCPATGNHQL